MFLANKESSPLREQCLDRAEPYTDKPMGFEEFNALIERIDKPQEH